MTNQLDKTLQATSEGQTEQPKRAFQLNIESWRPIPIPLQWKAAPVPYVDEKTLADLKQVMSRK